MDISRDQNDIINLYSEIIYFYLKKKMNMKEISELVYLKEKGYYMMKIKIKYMKEK